MKDESAENLFYLVLVKIRHDYYVYILLCADGSYYTGMTNNIERRLQEHEEGLVPFCYTYKRLPVVLKYSCQYKYVNDAIAREKQIKGWTRKKKEALINGDFDELIRLSKSRSRDLDIGDSKEEGQ